MESIQQVSWSWSWENKYDHDKSYGDVLHEPHLPDTWHKLFLCFHWKKVLSKSRFFLLDWRKHHNCLPRWCHTSAKVNESIIILDDLILVSQSKENCLHQSLFQQLGLEVIIEKSQLCSIGEIRRSHHQFRNKNIG